jgi:hypothetical protein
MDCFHHFVPSISVCFLVLMVMRAARWGAFTLPEIAEGALAQELGLEIKCPVAPLARGAFEFPPPAQILPSKTRTSRMERTKPSPPLG